MAVVAPFADPLPRGLIVAAGCARCRPRCTRSCSRPPRIAFGEPSNYNRERQLAPAAPVAGSTLKVRWARARPPSFEQPRAASTPARHRQALMSRLTLFAANRAHVCPSVRWSWRRAGRRHPDAVPCEARSQRHRCARPVATDARGSVESQRVGRRAPFFRAARRAASNSQTAATAWRPAVTARRRYLRHAVARAAERGVAGVAKVVSGTGCGRCLHASMETAASMRRRATRSARAGSTWSAKKRARQPTSGHRRRRSRGRAEGCPDCPAARRGPSSPPVPPCRLIELI